MKRNQNVSFVVAIAVIALIAMVRNSYAVGQGYLQSNVDLVKSNLDWTTIGSFSTKMSQGKLLELNTSGECGLYTETNVNTQQGKKSVSTASAAVYFRVLVNGQPATPVQVTYCSRTQTLSATLQGIINNCPVVNG